MLAAKIVREARDKELQVLTLTIVPRRRLERTGKKFLDNSLRKEVDR